MNARVSMGLYLLVLLNVISCSEINKMNVAEFIGPPSGQSYIYSNNGTDLMKYTRISCPLRDEVVIVESLLLSLNKDQAVTHRKFELTVDNGKLIKKYTNQDPVILISEPIRSSAGTWNIKFMKSKGNDSEIFSDTVGQCEIVNVEKKKSLGKLADIIKVECRDSDVGRTAPVFVYEYARGIGLVSHSTRVEGRSRGESEQILFGLSSTERHDDNETFAGFCE